tara:strand:+ start:97 stop:690 length:594 start_codon:yes stop_codon:yes gene_type:complete
MLAPVIAVGIAAWLLLREGKEKEGSADPEETPTTPTPTKPEDSSDLPPQTWTETASWSGEYAKKGYDGTERVVWMLNMGIRFTDGTTEMSDTTYILIGNKTHTAFRRTNSDRGTVDIKKEYTGGDSDVKNATVYASLEAAEAEVDRLSVEPEYDPTSPQPQKPPEEEEEEKRPPSSFPPQQGLNLGQNAGVGSYGGF